MNILIVCSGNALNFEFSVHQAFVYDQVEAVRRIEPNIRFDFFFTRGKGTLGYLAAGKQLQEKLNSAHFDCIHSHFSLSGLLANFQRRIPVITTYHGSDINFFKNRVFSPFTAFLSRQNLFVSQRLKENALYASPQSRIIPCGVDFELFKPAFSLAARAKMGFEPSKKYILFSSGFDNKVKNPFLAKSAHSLLNLSGVELLELKGYRRREVALLFSAVDVALMTSFSEGSPQFIKEAMACNCPIVATDVGDIREVMGDTEGCYLTSFDPQDVAVKIKEALAFGKRTNGREMIRHLDNHCIAKQIIRVYQEVIRRDRHR